MTLLKDAEFLDRGWATFPSDVGVSLDKIVSSLGQAVPPRPDRPLTRVLTPRDSNDEAYESFSYHHGRGRFPLHTDCAYYRRPPDVICFRARRPSTVATLLLDGYSVVPACGPAASNAFFRVRGLRKFFLCPMCKRGRLRWDPYCMAPADTAAAKVAELFSTRCSELSPIRFVYSDCSTILAVDNRRFLHAREDASADPARKLESVLLYTR